MKKLKDIHLVMPFSRYHLKDDLIAHYGPMGIMMHPIIYSSAQLIRFNRAWVDEFVILGDEPVWPPVDPCYAKINEFIAGHDFVDDDYYVVACDDDMFEDGVFDAIKKMDDDIVVISMKRADGWSTLNADPKSMKTGFVGCEQLFIKGHIFKTLQYNDKNNCADGEMAEALKRREDIRYEPLLFALWNYLDQKETKELGA